MKPMFRSVGRPGIAMKSDLNDNLVRTGKNLHFRALFYNTGNRMNPGRDRQKVDFPIAVANKIKRALWKAGGMGHTITKQRQGAYALTLSAGLAVLPVFAVANEKSVTTTVNLYGSAGVIDTPSAMMLEDGVINTTYSWFADTHRSTLSFQITPRLSGSFRYTIAEGLRIPGFKSPKYYDRSFDIRYQLLTETSRRPAVTIGLQDFIGTGLYGGEYIVASKEITPGLRLSGGLGWGRLGSYNPIGSFGTRPQKWKGTGGIPTYDHWFRGNVAPFAGVEWAVNDKLTFKAEYGSDNYWREERDGLFNHKSPVNFGLDYRFNSGTQFSVFSLYGDTVGALVSLQFNPNRPVSKGGIDGAPLPVIARSAQARRDLGWVGNSVQTAHSKAQLKGLMKLEGLEVEGMQLDAHKAVIRLRNPKYHMGPQAIGRAARAMSRALPGSVETFVIVPMADGMALSAVTLRRSDIESLENAAAADILARATISDGHRMAPKPEAEVFPRFSWSLGPYTAFSAFDPQKPFRADLGAELKASLWITPGVELSGSIQKRLVGDLDQSYRKTSSGLPRVRTNHNRFLREGDPSIRHLTLAAYGRPAQDFYTRVTAGYLERMYAGVSAEVLWKPVDSRLAFGAEVNFIKPREFDGGLGLRGYNTNSGTIPKFNGHVSAYYDFTNGFHGQLDVGRYLAGDYGATVTIDREFRNGWVVGAYATFTDASHQQFGEGSFDKGIRLKIPMSWAIGKSTQKRRTIEVQSLTRDGGAKLNVRGRLYEKVRGYHRPVLEEGWGRFWR